MKSIYNLLFIRNNGHSCFEVNYVRTCDRTMTDVEIIPILIRTDLLYKVHTTHCKSIALLPHALSKPIIVPTTLIRRTLVNTEPYPFVHKESRSL